MEDWQLGLVVLGAIFATVLAQAVLTREAQQDPRWVVLILAAVVVSAIAALLVSSLFR